MQTVSQYLLQDTKAGGNTVPKGPPATCWSAESTDDEVEEDVIWSI